MSIPASSVHALQCQIFALTPAQRSQVARFIKHGLDRARKRRAQPKRESYWEIVGKHTGEVIGVCTGDSKGHCASEDPGSTFNRISKRAFDSYGDRPWARPGRHGYEVRRRK